MNSLFEIDFLKSFIIIKIIYVEMKLQDVCCVTVNDNASHQFI